MATIDNVNTLSKFGTILDGDNQRVKFTHLPTRFRVRFVGFGVEGQGKVLTFEMKKFGLPKGGFEVQTQDYTNGEIKYPGKWKWDDLTFDVYNSYDNKVYQALLNQQQRQRNIYEQTTGDAPSVYKYTTIFEHTDGHQGILSQWVMEGCWLQKAHPTDAEAGVHTPGLVNCTITFDNASCFDKDGNQIPTADAGIITDITSAFAV